MRPHSLIPLFASATNLSGIGPRMDIGMRLQDYCSQGRLQVTWYQPVWVPVAISMALITTGVSLLRDRS